MCAAVVEPRVMCDDKRGGRGSMTLLFHINTEMLPARMSIFCREQTQTSFQGESERSEILMPALSSKYSMISQDSGSIESGFVVLRPRTGEVLRVE
jgi:hypothetical protein